MTSALPLREYSWCLVLLILSVVIPSLILSNIAPMPMPVQYERIFQPTVIPCANVTNVDNDLNVHSLQSISIPEKRAAVSPNGSTVASRNARPVDTVQSKPRIVVTSNGTQLNETRKCVVKMYDKCTEYALTEQTNGTESHKRMYDLNINGQTKAEQHVRDALASAVEHRIHSTLTTQHYWTSYKNLAMHRLLEAIGKRDYTHVHKCSRKTYIAVFVHVRRSDLELENKLQEIRNQWKTKVSNTTNMQLYFLTGTTDASKNTGNQSHSQQHNDVIEVDVIDNYLNLTLKTIAMLKWASLYCDSAKYLVKADDDIYINVNGLLTVLQTIEGMRMRSFMLGGGVPTHGVTIGVQTSVWGTNMKTYPHTRFPPYLAGFFYVLTNDNMPNLLHRVQDPNTPLVNIEDVFLTGIVRILENITRVGTTSISEKCTSENLKKHTSIAMHHYSDRSKTCIRPKNHKNEVKGPDTRIEAQRRSHSQRNATKRLAMISIGLLSTVFILAAGSDQGHYKVERVYDKGYGQNDGNSKAYHNDGNSKGYTQNDGNGKSYSDESRGGRYYYGGTYTGNCGPDGLYYRDEYSFVLCSNAKGYVQPCAPGTRNSGHSNYEPGYYYGYSDFCGVNLVDYGYSAPKHGPGYARQPSYGFTAYRHPDQNSYGYDSAPKKASGYGYENDRSYGKQAQRQDNYGGKQNGGYDSYASGKDRYNPHQSYGKADSYQTRTVYGKDNNYKY